MTRTKSHAQLAAYLVFCVAILAVPTFVDDAFLLNKYARYLALGLAAAAISLSWGYCGILNLGQGVSFGLGAYAIAMHLKLETSPIHTGSGGLPDFMMWNNLDSLPWFWVPFQSGAFALAAGVLLPGLVAALLGWFMFRARITGVYVAIITLAMLVVVNLLVVDRQAYTGGFNGITDLAWLQVGGVEFDPYGPAFYYLCAGSLSVCLLLGLALTRSKAGTIMQAIRGDGERVRFFGYDVAAYQILAFSVSAAMAGIAGMLYAMVLEFAAPTFMGVSLSLSMVIWAAVGGRGSLLGAAIGAILVNFMQGSLSEAFLDTWQLLLGAIFILVVVFLPRGLAGLFEAGFERLSRHRASSAAGGGAAVPLDTRKGA
ncbi:urea ABC transporter permease subunit UrtC [Arenibaculum sp.]|jgi:urea transport system permease protein|uniref:urea ABC transporter permease subunit UrtC n=1 Tax=Arenibaculum sp. TaxID=2865862 RepID=UPI002E155383|nr:urea ABC transporter permease subunit UrtC [Arenibaculum sp.]